MSTNKQAQAAAFADMRDQRDEAKREADALREVLLEMLFTQCTHFGAMESEYFV